MYWQPALALFAAIATTWWAQGGVSARRRKQSRALQEIWRDTPDSWAEQKGALERRLKRELTRLGEPEHDARRARTVARATLAGIAVAYVVAVTAALAVREASQDGSTTAQVANSALSILVGVAVAAALQAVVGAIRWASTAIAARYVGTGRQD